MSLPQHCAHSSCTDLNGYSAFHGRYSAGGEPRTSKCTQASTEPGRGNPLVASTDYAQCIITHPSLILSWLLMVNNFPLFRLCSDMTSHAFMRSILAFLTRA